jgi:hypothetical protein
MGQTELEQLVATDTNLDQDDGLVAPLSCTGAEECIIWQSGERVICVRD